MTNEQDVNALIDRNNASPNPHSPFKKVSKWKVDVAELNSGQITNKTSFPEPTPTICINGSTFAVENELSIITGLPKAGKSAVLVPMIAAPFVAGKNVDTLSIEAPDAKGRTVVYIDTEMSKGSTQKLHNQILRVIGTDVTPKNLLIYNWKKYRPLERLDFLKLLFEQITNLHIVFIDGIADFVDSVNDEISANVLLENLGDYAEDHNCSIVTVIHENFGNGQARGHIGSSLGRKCAGTISIKQDGAKAVTVIECKTLRHAPDFTTVFCQWDIDLKRLALLDADTAKSLAKESQKSLEEIEQEAKDKLQSVLKQAFGPDATLTKKELIGRVTLYHNPNKIVSEKTADRAVKEGYELGLLGVDKDKNYSLWSEVDAAHT